MKFQDALKILHKGDVVQFIDVKRPSVIIGENIKGDFMLDNLDGYLLDRSSGVARHFFGSHKKTIGSIYLNNKKISRPGFSK